VSSCHLVAVLALGIHIPPFSVRDLPHFWSGARGNVGMSVSPPPVGTDARVSGASVERR